MNKNIKKISAGTVSACVMLTLWSPVVKAEKMRFNGSNRIETAIKVGENYWEKGTDYIVMAAADNENLIDSLLAAPLAKAYDAPIINHFKGKNLDKTVISKLKDWNVKTIFLASGYSSFPKTFEEKLKAEGFEVIRLGDDDVEKTSLNIAKKLKEKCGSISKACLVSDDAKHLVDSLSISPIACMENMPILISHKDKLSKEVKDYIVSNKVSQVYGMGGNTILGDNVLNEVNAKRIFGNDRYDTNIKIIKEFSNILKFQKVYIASGRNANIVDALSGSVAAAKDSSPIILVGDNVNNVTKEFIRNNVKEESDIFVFGGEGAVSSSVADDIELIKNGEESGILKVKEISCIGTNTVLVKLKTSLNKLAKGNFHIEDYEGKKCNISKVSKAAWDKTGKTAVVNMEDAVTAGKVYTLNGSKFIGENIKEKRPVITSMESTDYNKVEITFSQIVDIKDLQVSFQNKNNGENLKVKEINYCEENPNVIEVATEDQKEDVMYASTINGAKSFEGNYMEKDDKKTFLGIKKDIVTPLEIKEAKALNPRNILIKFNSIVDKNAIKNLNNFTLTELHSSKCLNIKEARIAQKTDTDFKNSKEARTAVVITLSAPLEDSTMYTVRCENIYNTAGIKINNKKDSADFIGIGPFTTKMDITEEGNDIISVSSNRIRVAFKRHIDKATLLSSNFNITDVYSNGNIIVKSVNIINDRLVDLEVEGLQEKLYKIQFNNIKDVDGNDFDVKKSSKIFKGTNKTAEITAIESVKLLDDNTSLIVTFDNLLGENAEEVTNYVISNGVGNPVKAQRVAGDSKSIKLTIPKTINKLSYKITATNIQNLDGKVLDKELYKTFIGGGKDASEIGIIKAEALDRNTLKIYFDMPVKSKLIDGENKIWNSRTNSLNADSIGLTGRTNVSLQQYYNTYVYEDMERDNALIIRSESLNLSKANANSSNKFTLRLKGAKSIDVGYNDEPMKPISIEKVEAMNRETVRVYFNQPTKIEKNAELGKIFTNSNDAYKAQEVTSYNNGAYSYRLIKNAIPIDTTYKVYDLKVSSGYLGVTDNYLVVNPNITNSAISGVHDYTGNGKNGFVTLKDGDSSSNGVQQIVRFYGTIKAAEDIDDVSVNMINSRTIEVKYPEVMNQEENGENSVLNKNNYKLVDKDGKEIERGFLYVHAANIDYNNKENKVVITLNEDLPNSGSGYYIQVSKNVKNFLDTKYVKKSNGEEVRKMFSRSVKAPEKLRVCNDTYYTPSTRTLSIKLNEKAYGTLPYDKSLLLIDFKITMIDASGKGIAINEEDIEKITTNIKDSRTAKDDEIIVVFKNITSLKYLQLGKVELKENSTLKAINGQDSEKSEVYF